MATNHSESKLHERSLVWYGNNEASVTAGMTSLVVHQMLNHPLPDGVFHIGDVFTLGEGEVTLEKLVTIITS